MTNHQPRSTRPSVGLLPRAVRESLVAVVPDANAYGQYGPDLESLADLARDLKQLNIETWVPEPVAWEWAEHVAREWTAAKTNAKAAMNAARMAGLGSVFDPVYSSREEVIASCLERLASDPNLVVIPLSGTSAIEALKDQVLQRKPAKTKGSDPVKTGGSDSAWLREVLARVDSDGQKLLFMSGDGDIVNAFQQWKQEPPLMGKHGDIRAMLFPTEPASEKDVLLLARHLVDRMPEDLVNPADSQPLINVDSELLRQTLNLPFGYGENITRSYLTDLTNLAGLYNVLLLRPEPDDQADSSQKGQREKARRTLTAMGVFLAEAEGTHTTYYDGKDGPAASLRAVGAKVLVHAPIVFEIGENAEVSAHQDGEANVSLPDRFDEPEYALSALVEVLSTVPGLETIDHTDWDEVTEDDEVDFNTPFGLTVRVSRFAGEFGDSGLSVSVGDQQTSAQCEYDVTTWIGGREGMHMAPPFYLTVTDFSGSAGDGAWALSAWAIAELVRQSGSTGGRDNGAPTLNSSR